MIAGLGVDIAEIKRVWHAYQQNKRFLTYILTPNEQQVFQSLSCRRQQEFLAGRFSAKEAYSKAYGTGIGAQLSWHDIEVIDDVHGKPIVTHHPFDGCAFVSISHTEDMVFTEVILERDVK
ncbi:MAG: holo-ACP synthase [Candidatus Paralactobacillus gallistercoris]|uniref:Holo-[acyl-carrier-protein] synthase n=1 Tax=Candidatus Paralactobacillus gallistercoris TaxID=2838724 RepID=A0A948TK70_9LACO|nr:holo-ACP synthase [Candidatus Paralactobacillus gallistercoris]